MASPSGLAVFRRPRKPTKSKIKIMRNDSPLGHAPRPSPLGHVLLRMTSNRDTEDPHDLITISRGKLSNLTVKRRLKNNLLKRLFVSNVIEKVAREIDELEDGASDDDEPEVGMDGNDVWEAPSQAPPSFYSFPSDLEDDDRESELDPGAFLAGRRRRHCAGQNHHQTKEQLDSTSNSATHSIHSTATFFPPWTPIGSPPRAHDTNFDDDDRENDAPIAISSAEQSKDLEKDFYSDSRSDVLEDGASSPRAACGARDVDFMAPQERDSGFGDAVLGSLEVGGAGERGFEDLFALLPWAGLDGPAQPEPEVRYKMPFLGSFGDGENASPRIDSSKHYDVSFMPVYEGGYYNSL